MTRNYYESDLEMTLCGILFKLQYYYYHICKPLVVHKKPDAKDSEVNDLILYKFILAQYEDVTYPLLLVRTAKRPIFLRTSTKSATK